MSDDAARSDASAREPEPAASPVPSDQASDDRSAQETAEVSAPGNNQSGESDDTQPDAKSPAHDDDAAEATKKRKRSPEPEAADPATTTAADAPPLPTDELPPPLPDEEPPAQQDDGWEALWDHNVGAYYFYNRHTGVTQWENPRVPDATSSSAVPAPPGTSAYGNSSLGSPPRKRAGGYNPAIHGDFDPNADYAQDYLEEDSTETAVDANAAAAVHAAALGGDAYAQTANFNRFTGRFQASTDGPEQHNDENKSRRQLNAYFDVDAAANSHDGRSLKAERQNKRLSKKELQAFKAKAAKKKEEKRRAWLRD
ncbi:Protein transport protein SEC24 [Lasiodiplodia hormozganensis]|uniref:Protein transport protein SEC24 n=1 Tax=Lasiodiplodia hormozganensis TaxID=869390 RepID=A0AA39T0P6_9PEZI|nr:Protein transport protein SEC24 [Lasiodiplodia hormozganensis]